MTKAADRIITDARDYVRDVGSQGAASVASLTDAVTDVVADWADRAQGIARSTNEYVRSSPWRTAGLVALAGLAIGYTISVMSRPQTKRRRRG
jgi:ElaB/YqjD/DUF883 family membrane-anchored ribosome-binding protein